MVNLPDVVEAEPEVLDAANPFSAIDHAALRRREVSPPGMLTTVAPSACHTSPAMPVWRHFMLFRSSTVWIGFLNQPNACGPEGRIGNTTRLTLALLVELVVKLEAAAVIEPADRVRVVHAERAARTTGE